MTQDHPPPSESSDQEPQNLPELDSGSFSEAQLAQPPEAADQEPQPASEVQPGSEIEPQLEPHPNVIPEAEPAPQFVPVSKPHLSPPEESTAQKVQEVWNKVQPVLKTQTIKVLRGTSQILEGIAEKLEESGAPGSEKRSENMPPTSETAPDKLVPPFLTDDRREKFQQSWQQLQQWWTTVLSQIRPRLPESLRERFSDRALTGAIAAVLILFLWIVPGLFSSKPKPVSVAKAPPPEKVTSPVAKPTVPPQISAPKPTKSIAPKPVEEQPAPKSVEVSPSPVAKPPAPPPPPLKLTPEQKLIARIQDQVAEISNQYVNGLIQSVQANFRSSRLTIKVGDGWYSLSQPQQNKLADEMLGRTQELDFSKLEITDVEGTLLARSPVVGSEMIIVKRQVEDESELKG